MATADSPFAAFAAELDQLTAQQLRRQRRTRTTPADTHIVADGRAVLSFCSNDYLGLAHHPLLIDAAKQALDESGLGGAASHLVSGHHLQHARLEQRLQAFTGWPALSFATGYAANVGIIPALVGREDAIFADRLNHASLNDGCVLSRATFRRFAHQDLTQLATLLATTPARRRLIVVDGVYSMDGDLAPLPALLALAEEFDAWLYVDDAHGLGVLGEHGRGCAEYWGLHHPRLIQLLTFGKAAGVQGAAVCGDPLLIDWLLNRCRSYIYTTASPPALAAALCVSLDLIESGQQRRDTLRAHIRQLREGCAGLPWTLLPSETAIQPLLVGGNDETQRLAERLWQRGLWVPGIRPPTVPVGQGRLRISLSAAHTADDIRLLLEGLHACAREWG